MDDTYRILERVLQETARAVGTSSKEARWATLERIQFILNCELEDRNRLKDEKQHKFTQAPF